MNSRGLLNHSLDTANQIWLGSSDGPRIWSIETNRTWIYRHALVRATRSLIEFRGCIYSEASGCNINYLNFLTRPYLVGDLLYCIKLFCQILNGSYTTNTHKLCSNDRFVIWLAQAPEIETHVLLGISESHESRHAISDESLFLFLEKQRWSFKNRDEIFTNVSPLQAVIWLVVFSSPNLIGVSPV